MLLHKTLPSVVSVFELVELSELEQAETITKINPRLAETRKIDLNRINY